MSKPRPGSTSVRRRTQLELAERRQQHSLGLVSQRSAPWGRCRPYDPSICPNTGCFNTGNSGGGCGNPYGGYGGYGTGMNQPGFCPQQVPQQQPCSTQPCPSFPGFHPYQNNEFQYFGGQPATPSNAADPSRQNVMAAQSGKSPAINTRRGTSPLRWSGVLSQLPGHGPVLLHRQLLLQPGLLQPVRPILGSFAATLESASVLSRC